MEQGRGGWNEKEKGTDRVCEGGRFKGGCQILIPQLFNADLLQL